MNHSDRICEGHFFREITNDLSMLEESKFPSSQRTLHPIPGSHIPYYLDGASRNRCIQCLLQMGEHEGMWR